MDKQITKEELSEIKNLISTHNNIIFRFGEFSKTNKGTSAEKRISKVICFCN